MGASAALRNTLIPISTVFAGDTDSYIAGLTDYRADPPKLDEWVTGFAQAAERATGNAVRLSQDITALDEQVRDVTGSSSEIVFEPLPVDDPTQRRPDLTVATRELGWAPEIPLREGLERTAPYFRRILEA